MTTWDCIIMTATGKTQVSVDDSPKVHTESSGWITPGNFPYSIQKIYSILKILIIMYIKLWQN